MAEASRTLITAALAGLVCAASAACESSDDDGASRGKLSDSGVGGGGQAGAGGSAGAGNVSGSGGASGNAGTGGSAGADAGDAAPPDASTDAIADAKPDVVVDCDAGAEGGVITSSEVDPNMTLEKFTADCNALGGKLEIHPHCGGANSCKGMSYDTATHVLTHHSCKGLNTCAGYSCVLC
ncbi:MAG: hypothetical protein U0263_11730 [Polyangiaceae bacterium]